jgi:hypothetical protein
LKVEREAGCRTHDLDGVDVIEIETFENQFAVSQDLGFTRAKPVENRFTFLSKAIWNNSKQLVPICQQQ